MTPRDLLQAGKLSQALQALTAEVRDNPMDANRRAFLFELLCFTGEYDRAGKQLDILAGVSEAAALGAVLCHAALHAEKLRQELFAKKEFPVPTGGPEAAPEAGSINGKPFAQLVDADPRVGARLEVFAAGNYLWIPFEHVEAIEMSPPKRLRDLLWAPARVRTGPAFQMRDLGEVFLPVLCPFSWKHPDEAVRLGRASVWETDETGEAIPFGQKMFLADDEEFPLLELRALEFTRAGQTA